MVDLLERADRSLRSVFRTDRPVFIGTCTATGFMEMAVRSGVRRRALCLVGGAYGERFAGIVAATGRQVVRLSVPLGRTVEPEMLQDALRRSDVDAVTLVHSETSTGALAPLEELAAVAREFDDVVLLVDGASSLAGSPIETDAWGLDFVFTGSQGALALPPGLAIGVASERIADRARKIPERGAYLDLVAFVDAAAKNQPTNTPAIPLLNALGKQLSRIDAAGGVEARWARHEAMRVRVERWIADIGVELGFGHLAPRRRRSWTVSCLTVPSGSSGRELAQKLRRAGWAIGSGYGRLKNTTIRIGHMGDHAVESVADLLCKIEEVSA
jgi:aspartate aminotransferase-like enzyme